MGRRCCSCKPGSCELVDVADLSMANDFFDVFTPTGSFSVECFGTSSSGYDLITFTGSATLSLTYPDAIFSRDNLAFNLGSYVSATGLVDGDKITETVTFTFGNNPLTANVLEVQYTQMYGSVNYVHEDCTFTITYNNHLIYTRQNNEATYIDSILNTSTIADILLANSIHYIIRKEGKLQYYLKVNYDTYLMGVVEDADFNAPIHVAYSWSSTSSNATITFNPTEVHIWKPDNWWELAKYKNIPKRMPSSLSSDEAHALYNAVAYSEVEDEGCYSPEAPPEKMGDSVETSNSDIYFSELSPKIAIQFSGFKSSKTYISGIPIRAGYYIKVDDGGGSYHTEWVDVLDTTIKTAITVEEARRERDEDYDDEDADDEINFDVINGLKTDIIDLDGIMGVQAASWQNAKYNYELKWHNGAVVRIKYDAVEARILNGVTGGDKVVFQQMMPVTFMQNNEWYYSARIDEQNNSYHQGFRGYNASWGRPIEEWDSDQSEWVTNYYSWSHVGITLDNLCRLDPFAYYRKLVDSNYQVYNQYFTQYLETATDTFSIKDTTLEFRRGIVAPDIDINLSSSAPGTIDLILNKPDTTPFSTSDWLTSHIVDVSTPGVIDGYPAHGSITKSWYEDGDPNPKPNRDRTSPLGGYFKLQYTTGGSVGADIDQIIYEIEDQFGAKSQGLITIHFTGSDTYVEETVTPITSYSNLNDCSDYDTICEVKCTMPWGLKGDNTDPGDVDVYLHYVHDGKVCQISDLINNIYPRIATLKIPSPWTTIDGTLQDTVQVTFVNPVHTDCDFAHDFNFGLENSFLLNTEPDNVDHLEATVQLWDKSDYSNPVATGLPFTVDLNPTDPVGCPSSSEIGLSHNANVSTVYEGAFQYTYVYNGSTYTVIQEISVAGSNYNSIPYRLVNYIRELKDLSDFYRHYTAYEVTKITIVYTSEKEVEIALHSLAPCPSSDRTLSTVYDYPKMVLSDFYND